MWSTRTARALAGAALLSILTVVPASAGPMPPIPPDVRTGVTGRVSTLDQPDLAGVACAYATDVLPT